MMKEKGLNINQDYNKDYNITFSPHLVERKPKHLLDFDFIEKTVIKGRKIKRTRHPKVCKRMYFGKENATYFVVFIRNFTCIKVITAWKTKGR